MKPNSKKRVYAPYFVEHIDQATFCGEMSPHQELVNKIKGFDLSCHTPQECLNFVYELKKLIESYG